MLIKLSVNSRVVKLSLIHIHFYMTDEFKEVISGIRERITNPLVSAFVLSWLVANWQFWYVLVFADTSDVLAFSGQASKYGYAQSLITIKSSLCYPLTFAILYVLVMPFIKGGIHLVVVWVKKRVTKRVEKNRIGDFVAFKKHLDLFDKYVKLKQDVSEYSKEEADLKLVNDSLKGEINSLEVEVRNRMDENIYLSQISDDWGRFYQNMMSPSILDGDYTLIVYDSNTNVRVEYFVVFKEGQVSQRREGMNDQLAFTIRAFSFNSKINSVSFAFYPINGLDGRQRYDHYDLTIKSDGLLTGFLGGSIRVEFRPHGIFLKYLDEINYFKRR